MENTKRVGRPHITLTEKQIEQIEKLASYLTCGQIADFFEICKKTFYNLRSEDERIAIAYEKGKAQAIKIVAKSLMKKIVQGDTTAIIFYLKTQAGWSEKQFIETKDITPHEYRVINIHTRNKEKSDESDRLSC